MSSTMTAAVIRQHGGPERLLVEQIDRPVAGSGEVLVRVGACALNHLDVFVRRGMPGVETPLPHTTGGDIAGWVEEVGSDVVGTVPGAAVLVDPAVEEGALGENRPGGLAEYVAVPAANLIPLRDGELDRIVRVAMLPIAYGTAQRMLFDRARLQADETVVVVGASGGVGVACIELARRAGARVIAVTSSAAKGERLSALGAHDVVVARDGEFGGDVWRATGKQGADVVVDYSGAVTWPQSVRCTKPHGRLVTCGATSGHDAVTDLRYVWVRELDIRGSDGWTREGLLDLVRMVEDGDLDPVLHKVLPLSRVHEGFAELEERRAFGKVVIVPDAHYASLEGTGSRDAHVGAESAR
jgi:alcohol dehydrogenase